MVSLKENNLQLGDFPLLGYPNVLKIAIYTGENEGFQHQNLGASKFQTNLNGCDWTGFWRSHDQLRQNKYCSQYHCTIYLYYNVLEATFRINKQIVSNKYSRYNPLLLIDVTTLHIHIIGI